MVERAEAIWQENLKLEREVSSNQVTVAKVNADRDVRLAELRNERERDAISADTEVKKFELIMRYNILKDMLKRRVD